MKTFTVFPGNCPHNVNKDAKYSVRGTDDRVGLMYSTASGETWHMTTDAHPDLADMVNDVKRTHGTAARGPFYVNEYKQVIVQPSRAATPAWRQLDWAPCRNSLGPCSSGQRCVLPHFSSAQCGEEGEAE